MLIFTVIGLIWKFGNILKLINNVVFSLDTSDVSPDGFELLEKWLESLWKGQYTKVQLVQSKSVKKAT